MDYTKIVYISLGSDCSVAYQIQKFVNQSRYPFDWIRINNIYDLEEIIETKFQFFINFDLFNFDKESDKFPYFEDNWIDDTSSNIIIKHKKYNIVFPHDVSKKDKDISLVKMMDGYKRRIERFYETLNDKNIKKVFIRLTHKNEDITKLNILLSQITCNYEIKLIKIDKTIKYESWKKDEINWKDIIEFL